MPGRNFNMVVKKVCVDQLIASPIVSIFFTRKFYMKVKFSCFQVILIFFATLGVMRKESFNETKEEIRHKFLRLYKAEWIGKWLLNTLNSKK